MPELVSAAPTEFKKVLTGKLDNKLALHVELERKGAKLTGSYYYEKVGAANVAEKLLSLAGKIDKEGKVTLVETAFSGDKGDEKSGEFKGALDGVTINGEQTLRFLGVWTDVKGKKSLPVTLQELRYDLGGLKFSEKQIQETNKKARLEITASVPQLSGDAAGAEAFNKTALALITKAIAQFKKDAAEAVKAEQEAATSEQKPLSQQATAAAEKSGAGQSAAPALKENKPAELPPLTFDSGYEVVYANAEMVSVLFSYSTYFGGAHPNRSSLAFNYDLKRAAEVKLPDLFAPKAGYLKVIADYSIKELKKLHTTDGVAEGAAAKAENFKRWNVTPLGLRFTFDPYQVGPYATGEHEVTVPYALLKSLANPAGWLAKLANV
ncbi:MAG: DUF3298 and DUF4163 domain-containing protein [Acidobacteria bacterium]|nr:DUF3298 and DUF4163 domain-containing protein [Acidobacteriota bacterium]